MATVLKLFLMMLVSLILSQSKLLLNFSKMNKILEFNSSQLRIVSAIALKDAAANKVVTLIFQLQLSKLYFRIVILFRIFNNKKCQIKINIISAYKIQ